ncbi:expressed unknown protein [Seminavis robusta]|uniref:Uncharacterized protein n=1 Tax=Seminavis robusta TaxID=568900 RepID=A0A9N8DS14_9STRA|nr:expressed unknown protein [Seminavis robusta]|eukprot:Sro328_g118570.1 n/a (452) ;mRNA; f:13661-15237
MLLASDNVTSFVPFAQQHRPLPQQSSSATCLYLRQVKVGLLDVPDPQEGKQDENQPLVVMPLPSDHLPNELRDLNVYGMELTRPVHKLIMEDAVERASSGMNNNNGDDDKPIYGHVAWKPQKDSWEGAIGCVSEIILQADGGNVDALLMGGGVDQGSMLETAAQQNEDGNVPKTVVTSGGFRFVVRKVIQEVPFPVAMVEELPDEDPSDGSSIVAAETEEDDEEEDDDDEYSDMDPPEMMKELFRLLQTYVDKNVQDAANQQMSPLEEAILEGAAAATDPITLEKVRSEQVAATLIAFRGSILDIAPTPTEGYFCIAFMAAEIMDLKNSIRRKLLTMVDGTERLRVVLRQVKEATGMAQARRMAKEITDANDESSRDLKVGTPELPPWSRQITKGMKLEYYWNEEWEWCAAEVIDDPVMVVDELLVTVRFDDGEVHKLPFHPDEKARWRPA